MFSTLDRIVIHVGGYHEYIWGISLAHPGMFSSWNGCHDLCGENHEYVGEYHDSCGGYHEYIGACSVYRDSQYKLRAFIGWLPT